MSQENEEPRGFRVSDRRRFTEQGEVRAPHDEPPPASGPSGEPADPPTGEAATDPGPRAATLEMTFSTFILGLSTQALLHLGEIPDPQTGTTKRDLPAARQVIDILGILKQKTVNNLERAEQALLDSVLHDLRMAFVRLVRAGTRKEDS